ncbi:MAG TPA: TonB-dependent receptor, partial [Verrucomicrobiae bacterium]|nr:TonB-dependent receptor [Verrucomicrobiae bacterium]
MGKTFERAAALALAAGLVSTGAAFAQQAPSPAAPGVEEEEAITVVARRRAESLDAVPSSADVVTAQTLEDAAVENGKDLSRLVAGVQVLDNGTGLNDEMIIRGEGGTRQNNIEPGAGLYRNGVFIAGGNVGGRNFVGLDFFDVEQVEILRGPQGAYFGRNAIGGAINVISARPSGEHSLDLRVDYGSQERAGLEAVANTSIGDLELRFGGFYAEQNDGWYTSTRTGRVLDYSERSGVRLSAEVEPSPNWRFYGVVEYGAEDAPAPQVFEYALAMNDPPYNDPGPTGYSVDRFEKPLDLDPRMTRDTFNTLFQAEWDMGFAELVSITGFRERNATSDTDADFNAASAVARALTATSYGEETFQRIVQDTRLQSDGDGFRWMIGVEYNKVDSDFAQNLTPIVPTSLPAGCAGGVCTLPVAQATARSVYRDVRSDIDDTSWAAYGSVSWDIASNLELSFDLRYTRDEKNFVSLETRRLDNPATPANEQVQLLIDETREFEVFTPGVSVNYSLANGGSIYGRLATGYRGGGFNNDPGEPNDGVSDIALPRSFEPEYVTSFELGTRGRLARALRY